MVFTTRVRSLQHASAARPGVADALKIRATDGLDNVRKKNYLVALSSTS